MRADTDTQRVARVALTLAGVDAAAQRRALDALPLRLDRAAALARRDAAIRDAHRLVGNPRLLTAALHEFYARAWPQLRHLVTPPDDAAPLRRAYFFACQACDDAGADMPGLRQIRRIIL
ncbi:MAG: hypothetical protein Q8L71_11350 [Thiobacillus sp.]|nr:hypothetical protein [Thiobacillus sp.]